MDERTDDPSDYWATAISDIAPGSIRLHGYPVEQLIGACSFTETIWLMLRGELPGPWQARLLEVALVSAVDHGPMAPSIAAARMASTCGLPLNNAMATGANLLGDVHGGAGQQCMEFFERVRGRLGRDAHEQARGRQETDPLEQAPGRQEPKPLERAVADELGLLRAQGRHMPGFGHRFHPRDPRRDPLLGLVAEAVDDGAVDGRYLAIALEVERALSAGRERPIPMNIDGATATVYSSLGFAPELGRGLFVLSRSVGILAHAWEERQGGRRIKGPIPPPLLATYTGRPRRDVPNP
jgi:citrate synthase